MKYYNKSIVLFIMILILITMTLGCSGSNPIIPGIINPNPSVNPENDTLSYIQVSSSSAGLKLGESVQIIVKGYNSDNEQIILDKSKVYSWGWTVQGQCYNCIKPFVELTPKIGSLTTTFSSGVKGTFFIVAYYLENAGEDYLTDYAEITVTD